MRTQQPQTFVVTTERRHNSVLIDRTKLFRAKDEGAEETGEHAKAAGGRDLLTAVRGEEGAGARQVRGGVPGPGQEHQADIRRQAHQDQEERTEGEGGGGDRHPQEVLQPSHHQVM